MPDAGRCLEDGFSTAGSPGQGLGAVARLADPFDVHSEPGAGTVAPARVHLGPPPPLPETLRIGAVHLPMPGEEACGDAWAADERPDRRRRRGRLRPACRRRFPRRPGRTGGDRPETGPGRDDLRALLDGRTGGTGDLGPVPRPAHRRW